MNPQGVFCANPACADRGAVDKGNIKVHSQFVCVITLLSHGCPLPAVVAAFGLDERTVADWQAKAGSHCQDLHQHHLESNKLELQHVEADELYAKRQGGRSWVSMAMAVPT